MNNLCCAHVIGLFRVWRIVVKYTAKPQWNGIVKMARPERIGSFSISANTFTSVLLYIVWRPFANSVGNGNQLRWEHTANTHTARLGADGRPQPSERIACNHLAVIDYIWARGVVGAPSLICYVLFCLCVCVCVVLWRTICTLQSNDVGRMRSKFRAQQHMHCCNTPDPFNIFVD